MATINKISDLANGKLIQFPIEVSPAQVIHFDETLFEMTERICERAELDQYGGAAEQMAGLTLEQLDHRPEWLRKFSAPDYDTYQSFPALSELQCECEDCMCTQPPTNWVETRWANFKLCSQCLDGCAKHVEKVVDFETLTDEQLCNDWELRR
jgi:hypothetical protein